MSTTPRSIAVLVLGVVGAGKTTLARALAVSSAYAYLSGSAILREHSNAGDARGVAIREAQDRGAPVVDDVLLPLYSSALGSLRGRNVIIDGNPRDAAQGAAIVALLDSLGYVTLGVLVEVREADALARIKSRAVCVACDAPATSGTPQCASCGGALAARADDDVDAVTRKVEWFQNGVLPFAAILEADSRLLRIDGLRGTPLAIADLRVAIEAFIAQMSVRGDSDEFRVILVNPTTDRDFVSQISSLLMRTSHDLKESVGGHVPDAIVETIIQRQYTTLRSVSCTFAESGLRFCLVDRQSQVVATVLVARAVDFFLVQDSRQLNVPFDGGTHAPPGLHQVFNLAVLKEQRRQGLARLLLAQMISEHRNVFCGTGLWMRGEPPDHDALTALGFLHASQFDVFFPDGVALPSGVRSPRSFNEKFACQCAHPPEIKSLLMTCKLKYGVFVRRF